MDARLYLISYLNAVATPKTPKTQRTNERRKPLNPQRILVFQMVPGGGVEPPRGCPRRILSPLRLPVPPSRLGTCSFSLTRTLTTRTRHFDDLSISLVNPWEPK